MPRASRGRGDAARRHADTIRFVLFEARPAGLVFHQLVRASALTPSQVRSGIAALKDQAAEKGWPPLTWTRADGYRLGAEPDALETYERAVVREKLTEFRRLHHRHRRTPRCPPGRQVGTAHRRPAQLHRITLDLIASS